MFTKVSVSSHAMLFVPSNVGSSSIESGAKGGRLLPSLKTLPHRRRVTPASATVLHGRGYSRAKKSNNQADFKVKCLDNCPEMKSLLTFISNEG